MCPERQVYYLTNNYLATNLYLKLVVIELVDSITFSKVRHSTNLYQVLLTPLPQISIMKTYYQTRWTVVMPVFIARTIHHREARRCPLISTLSSWVTSNFRIGDLSKKSVSRALMTVHTSGVQQECRSVHLIMQECLEAREGEGTMVVACSTIQSFDHLSKVRIDCHSAPNLYHSLKTLLNFYFFL